MMRSRWRLTTTLMCAATMAFAPHAAAQTFRKVADTATAIPGGVGAFTSFAEFSSGAPVIENGLIAFYATGSGGQEGVYTESGGALQRLVDRSTTYPDNDGVGSFGNISGALSIGAGRVKFSGSGNVGQSGVFTASLSAVDPLYDTTTPHPNGQGNFSVFGNTGVGDGEAVFFGGNNSDTGYYLRSVTGGPITTIFERLDIMPGSVSDQAFGFGVPDIEGDVVAFTASGGPTLERQGVYLYESGTLSALYDSTMTAIPGGTGNFTRFTSVRLSGGKVLFSGEGDTEEGIYSDVSGSLAVVADLNTPAPGGGMFDQGGFIYGSLDGTGIAFWSYLAGGGNGIYTNLNAGELTKVIATGDELDGKTVTELDYSREGLSGDEIAFRAVFGDGSSGIFVASYLAPAAPGDFNGNAFVDGEDLELWSAGFGTTNSTAGDADDDHDVDGNDLLIWQQALGPVPPAAIPEPAAATLLVIAGLGPALGPRRSRLGNPR